MGWASYKALGVFQGCRGQEDLVSCNSCFQDCFGVCKLGVTGLIQWVSSSGVITGSCEWRESLIRRIAYKGFQVTSGSQHLEETDVKWDVVGYSGGMTYA